MTTTNQQRVNIQYSVNVEEVPKLLMDLLREALSRLEEATSEATSAAPELQKQVLDFDNYSFGLNEIDTIRRTLADIDYRLSDCGMILSGLESLKHPSPLQTTDAVDEINKAAYAASEVAGAMGNHEHE